jgi:hypothetical protein
MHRLDRHHLKYPFAGVRMLKGFLAAKGSNIVATVRACPSERIEGCGMASRVLLIRQITNHPAQRCRKPSRNFCRNALPRSVDPRWKLHGAPPVANQVLSNESQAIPTIQVSSRKAGLRQHREFWVIESTTGGLRSKDPPRSPFDCCQQGTDGTAGCENQAYVWHRVGAPLCGDAADGRGRHGACTLPPRRRDASHTTLGCTRACKNKCLTVAPITQEHNQSTV